PGTARPPPSARCRTGHRAGCGRPPACPDGRPPEGLGPFSRRNPPPSAFCPCDALNRPASERNSSSAAVALISLAIFSKGGGGRNGESYRTRLALCAAPARRSDGDDAVANGVLDQLRGGLQSEGLQDAGLVELGRSGGHVQNGRNLLGGAALGKEL